MPNCTGKSAPASEESSNRSSHKSAGTSVKFTIATAIEIKLHGGSCTGGPTTGLTSCYHAHERHHTSWLACVLADSDTMSVWYVYHWDCAPHLKNILREATCHFRIYPRFTLRMSAASTNQYVWILLPLAKVA